MKMQSSTSTYPSVGLLTSFLWLMAALDIFLVLINKSFFAPSFAFVLHQLEVKDTIIPFQPASQRRPVVLHSVSWQSYSPRYNPQWISEFRDRFAYLVSLGQMPLSHVCIKDGESFDHANLTICINFFFLSLLEMFRILNRYIKPMISKRVAADLRKRSIIEGTFGSFVQNEGS